MADYKGVVDNPRMNAFHRDVAEHQLRDFPTVGFVMATCERQPDGTIEVFTNGAGPEGSAAACWCEVQRQLNWVASEHARVGLKAPHETIRVKEQDNRPPDQKLRLVK